MEKLGLLRDIDLALHLPLRYEDETRLTLLRDEKLEHAAEQQAVDEHLGRLDAMHDAGPKAPQLAPLAPRLSAADFCRRAFVAAVIGGIGSIPGAMLGGLLIGVLGELTKLTPMKAEISTISATMDSTAIFFPFHPMASR